ncbi:ectoine hydroxylase-related dioxygenase (phytanoyl-CoA dioxygenase family) [Friedmanniella endophytica]|uniref:Ectoine hydroxylase-related dioxygenase (Phytanoyl-CoA dioxygenase family) n=1 Tax=Microlunatus kandeliicorticis TaxID=1759536 RepID=A0A7W3P703_9ACTN|nr:phytanoyl-CoA dioxygenase family protein [Microlunatus kandeliicorticis]MBA8795508.1 ectoine hydroxylase-related dioxygenase (phytanoyl-CoA dioxygenase family) [Microlunatus kandeliicorticis]
MTTMPTVPTVTQAQRRQYVDEGWFVLERALSDDQLALLRGVADYAVTSADAQMDAEGVDALGLTTRGKRYFSSMIYRDRPELRAFLFSDLMAEVCRATLGEEAYLFWEQYVIKAGDPDTTFAWHQDSGYVHENHAPYLTCWIALDDITLDNGPVYLLPYSRSGIRSYIRHVRDDRVNDQVCYFGSDPGMPVLVPAGSVVAFSSVVIHRSGPNLTDRLRRVYLAQYSGEVITTADGSEPWGSFEPFLHEGRVVADR